MKKIGFYLLYLVAFFLVIFSIAYMQNVILNYRNQHFEYSVLYIIVSIILGVVTGLLLGIEKFIIELKRAGKWKVNCCKIVILGLPMLIFSFILIFYFKNLIPFFDNDIIFALYGNSMFVYIIFSIILGYTIISSFYKAED